MVRDNGILYSKEFPTHAAEEAEKARVWALWEAEGIGTLTQLDDHILGGSGAFRSNYQSKAYRPEREAVQTKFRAQVRNAMKHEDWEGIPRFRRTSGWDN